jgi:hypothetical protein
MISKHGSLIHAILFSTNRKILSQQVSKGRRLARPKKFQDFLTSNHPYRNSLKISQLRGD